MLFPALLKIRESKRIEAISVLKCHIAVWRNPFPRSECTNYSRTKARPINAAITGSADVAADRMGDFPLSVDFLLVDVVTADGFRSRCGNSSG
jgi:hypothetical protein